MIRQIKDLVDRSTEGRTRKVAWLVLLASLAGGLILFRYFPANSAGFWVLMLGLSVFVILVCLTDPEIGGAKGIALSAAKVALWATLSVITIVVMTHVAPLLFPVAPLLFPESQWAYALRYNTDSSYVQIEPKPTDCDWDYAPLGRKGCHYERVVSVTKYSTDAKTGRSIVTYNDGKTWDWVPEGQKAGRAQVYVTWSKMAD